MADLIGEVRESLSLPDGGTARQIREAAHVTQERLAAELGVSRVTVARYELGLRHPHGPRRLAYARVLNSLRREVDAAGGQS